MTKPVTDTTPSAPIQSLNTHPIDQKIQSLKSRLQEELTNPEHLQNHAKNDEQLHQIKVEIKTRLVELQGKYYQDPNSLLDQAFKKAKKDPSQQERFDKLRAEAKHLTKELDSVRQAIKILQPRQRIYEIKTELQALCGSGYQDKNGLLHRTWQAYKSGKGCLEAHENLKKHKVALEQEQTILEARSRALLERIEPTSSEISLETLIQQREKAIAFETDLTHWCNEKRGSPEYRKRVHAAEKIRKCYREKRTGLDLARLQLTSLPRGIGQLTQLTHLDTSDNRLQNLPEEIRLLTQLTHLDVSGNQLQSLPEEIRLLTQLTHLNVSGNRLQSLPAWIVKLTQLTWLNIAGNQLESLPAEIRLPTQLTHLDASTTSLQSLPEGIRQCIQLTHLNVSGNRLQSLPVWIGQFTQLTELYANANRLQNLPTEIGQCTQLTNLVVCGNYLRNLPEEIRQCTQLTRLNVGYNLLQSLPAALAQLPRSAYIRADNNRLTPTIIQAFQQEIARQQALNPALGPRFEFSIYEPVRIAAQAAPKTLQEEITYWLMQFNQTFPVGDSIRSAFPEALLSTEGVETSTIYQSLFDQSEEVENRLSDAECTNLMNFLRRLQSIQDYLTLQTRPKTILRVVQMLHGAVTNQTFRDKLLFIIGDALSSCGDRVTICWNMIELYWNLYCCLGDKKDMPEEEWDPFLDKAKTLLVGAKRLELLDKHVEPIIRRKRLGDAIESKLFCQVQLREALQLSISTQGMLYAHMAGIDSEDLEELQGLVLSQTGSLEQIMDILAPLQLMVVEEGVLEPVDITIAKLWGEKIKQRYAEEFDLIVERADDEIYEIGQNMGLSEQRKLVAIKAISAQQQVEELRFIREKTTEWMQKPMRQLGVGG
ncbi:MAG: leucine-rich repeat domain-containing protein [Anaplasmataceae bacterium]|nr:leucine-rich repeat domain-containing protein [Anaplasmataceae bacterium]